MSTTKVNTRSGILVCWLIDEDCGLYAENMQKNFIHCLLNKRKNPEIFWNFSSLNREKKDTVGFTQVNVCIRGHHDWSSRKNVFRDLDCWKMQSLGFFYEFCDHMNCPAIHQYHGVSYFEIALR